MNCSSSNYGSNCDASIRPRWRDRILEGSLKLVSSLPGNSEIHITDQDPSLTRGVHVNSHWALILADLATVSIRLILQTIFGYSIGGHTGYRRY